MDKNKKPAIRFNGFTEDWEQYKVKELCSISTGKSNTQDKIDEGMYPFYVRSPIIERSTKYLYDEEAVLTVGDGVGTGKVFHYVNGKYDLHQRCYRIFEFSDELNAKYFYHTFSLLFYKRVITMTAKTSVDSVRYEMIADMDIPVPSIDEQKTIAATIDNLDYLITIHQHKYEKLQNIKKSLLEKMFPKSRSRVPEIRFKGFTEDWEHYKLSELGEATSGTSIESEFCEGGKYKVISIGSYSEDSTYIEQGLKVDLTKKTKNRVLNQDDLTMILNDKTSSGRIIGRTLIIEKSDCYVFNQRTQRIEPYHEEYSSQFLYTMFNASQIREKIIKQSQGNTQIYVNWSKIKETIYQIPKKEEQEKIGDFFKYFDHLINLHQRKIENLKNIKKSCIEKMFI